MLNYINCERLFIPLVVFLILFRRYFYSNETDKKNSFSSFTSKKSHENWDLCQKYAPSIYYKWAVIFLVFSIVFEFLFIRYNINRILQSTIFFVTSLFSLIIATLFIDFKIYKNKSSK